MQKYFLDIYNKLPLIASETEVRVRIVSSIRHLLQMIDFALLEWIGSRSPDPETQPPHTVMNDLLVPSDGTLVDALEALLISAEQNGWSGAYRPLVREVDDDDPCAAICGENPLNLLGLLRGIVALRNDGGEGHGLPGQYLRDSEESAYKFIVDTLADVIPRLSGDVIEIGPNGLEVVIRMLRVYSGNPVFVRKIKVINASTVRVQGKYYNSQGVLENISYDASNLLSRSTCQRIPSFREFPNSWHPMCYMPDRVTDTFVGRDTEQQEIVEWLDDVEQRACLVFGDGGVGKTTLVVETLQRVLEEELKISWHPKVMTFYTAKRLQFGVDGLAPVKSGRPHLMDLLAHIHVLFQGSYPDSSFYRAGIVSASTKLQEIMKSSFAMSKQDHLIVIDNAETLIESDEERDLLGKELKEIARRVGRILLTSRRREILGADPVEVQELTKVDAVHFLRSRGAEKLKISAVKRASDVELLSVVDELERRPIVLDAFLNALVDPSFGTIEKAKKKVADLLQKDLGTFLFSDAWGRFSKEVRSLLLLMTRVADVHDSQSFRICCDDLQVPMHDAEKALQESSGIASIVKVGGEIQISFSKNFLDYCRGRDGPSAEKVAQIRRRYSLFVSRTQSFTGDRVLEAFRIPVAKAAHRAAEDGDFDAARELYEQAILSDSANGLLFDRYAFFLFKRFHHNEAALHQAKRATSLLPNHGDCWFTRGMIEGRLGDARAAEASLQKAESLGVAKIRCSLQRAWSFLKSRPRPQLALAEKELKLLDAMVAPLPINSRDRLEVRNIRERYTLLTTKGRFRSANKSG